MTETNNKKRLVVLVSGNGSNLQAIINASEAQKLCAEVVAVVANNTDAFGLTRAKRHHIAYHALVSKGTPRATYDANLATLVNLYQPDYIVLAGWMRILSMEFLQHFPDKVINLHPSLPKDLPGINAISRAYARAKLGGTTKTGVMVHFVPDEGVDEGPVICQESLEIELDESLEMLESRVHELEHNLLIQALNTIC